MRHVLTLTAMIIGGSIGFGFSSQYVAAAPLPSVSALIALHTQIETVGYWKRYWRRYGYGPDVVIPDADVDVDVEVDADAPAVVVLPPPRPLSCGQYRYWNGMACVDARYTDPYLGPK